MFERFDDQARRVVVLAQGAARPHATITGAHLLAAVAIEGSGTAAAVLAAHGLDETSLATALGRVCPPATGAPRQVHVPFSDDARDALAEATNLAVRTNSALVDPTHVALAVLTDPTAEVAALCAYCSADPASLAVELAAAMGGGNDNGATAVAPPRDDDGGQDGPAPAGRRPLYGRRSGDKRPGSRVLETFGRNLTQEARDGRLDPVIGRKDELVRLFQVLGRRTKANPVLVGEPGVGKTAVVEGLALAIAAGEVPEHLEGVELWEVDLASMVAGTRLRGDFEERVKELIKALEGRDDVIAFIDEIHNVVGTGSSQGSTGVAELLKPALARGAMRVVGATTNDEFIKYFASDAALERRFAPVEVAEPDEATAVAILAGLRATFADHHDVEITDDALRAAARLAKRHLPDHHLPDSAIDLLDEAGAAARLRRLRQRSEAAAAAAADSTGTSTATTATTGADEAVAEVRPVISEREIAEVCSVRTGVPVSVAEADEIERLLGAEALLAGRVVGQDDAVSCVARAVRRRRSGLGDHRRPAGSFLFAGPSGVGKTELAKALAELLFSTPDSLITIDMSEYMEAHSVARLIGAPPGYVGHEEGGQLTEAVRRRPHCVVLLDEVEKAHPQVFDALLAVLEEGRLTDSQGRKVSFSDAVIVMTTNLGTADLARPTLGFSANRPVDAAAARTAAVTAALAKHFRPEFLNRIDEVVCFSPLEHATLVEIARLLLGPTLAAAQDHGLALTVTDAACSVLAASGSDPSYGARPMRRAIQNLVADPLAELLLGASPAPGSSVCADATPEGEITFIVLDPVEVPVVETAETAATETA